MAARKLLAYLDTHQINYVVITHSRSFTAQQVAASAHISGKELAKTVLVRIDGKMAMAVLPAPYLVDLEAIAKVAHAKEVILCSEEEFLGALPDCQVGAMPPFGNLYDMEVYVAAALAEDREIAFNAGTHRELVKMMYQDYEQLVEPHLGRFAVLPETL